MGTMHKRLLDTAAALVAVGRAHSGSGGQRELVPAHAQESESEGDDFGQRMHIEAQRLDDGRTEFALRLHDPEGRWEDRILPNRRLFPVRAATDRWLWSAPVPLRQAPDDPAARIWVRITARRLATGASSSACSTAGRAASGANGCCRSDASSPPLPALGDGSSVRR